jgi:aspartyl-tRNA(Asn)/glutamyl-tRNA(Gln) amidotransferase subunit A
VNLHDLTLVQARDTIADRRLGAHEYCRALLDRTAALDLALGCYLEMFAERALDRAREIDSRQGMGEYLGPLAGIPIAIKDNICTDFGRTTCGSRMLADYRSPFAATAVGRLERAGAVITGKTNLDEFAMGSSSENSALSITRNPWDTSRVPGGSSGGSAAAVAARLVPAALGSDTGGSVRQPAAFCGVVGLKPTYGRVSRWGLVAYASSLDQIGPITRSVADAALLMETIAGRDPLDSTCADRDAPSLLASLDEPITGLRIGVPRECRSPQNHPAVAQALDRAAAAFRDVGATVVDVDLPHLKYGIAAYYIIATAEASSNLARFDGVRYGHRAALAPGEELFDLYARSRAEGLGIEVQRRIMLGTYALSSGYYDAYYLTALKARRLIQRDFVNLFSGPAPCDALLMPTAPTPAFKIGEKSSDPLTMYLEDVYTVTANLAGVPAISLPAGFAEVDGKRLPVGVQLLGPMFAEDRLLRAARMYEQTSAGAALAPAL